MSNIVVVAACSAGASNIVVVAVGVVSNFGSDGPAAFLQAVSMGELYGEVNKLTMEWRDGLMALKVRQCVQV